MSRPVWNPAEGEAACLVQVFIPAEEIPESLGMPASRRCGTPGIARVVYHERARQLGPGVWFCDRCGMSTSEARA